MSPPLWVDEDGHPFTRSTVPTRQPTMASTEAYLIEQTADKTRPFGALVPESSV